MNLKRDITPPKLDVKAPRFLADLYADLRDRHLLPLVIALVAAIAVVPLLLAGKDGGEAEPAPAPATSGGGSAEASFSVVPANPGLRDYRKRLGHRSAKDPFEAPDSKPRSTAAAAGGSPEASHAAGAVPSAGSAGGEAATGRSPSGGSGGSPSEAKGGDEESNSTVVVERKVAGFEINAHLGFVGHLRDREGIQPTTKLPSKKNTVVVFMGLAPDDKHALFLMTNSVTAYYGKGRCALEKESCQLLELAPGRSATFAYGYGDTRYKLTLKKIVPVVKAVKTATTKTKTTVEKTP